LNDGLIRCARYRIPTSNTRFPLTILAWEIDPSWKMENRFATHSVPSMFIGVMLVVIPSGRNLLIFVEPPPHSCALNQRGQTRMLGGVGRVPGNGHPYPISVLCCDLHRPANGNEPCSKAVKYSNEYASNVQCAFRASIACDNLRCYQRDDEWFGCCRNDHGQMRY